MTPSTSSTRPGPRSRAVNSPRAGSPRSSPTIEGELDENGQWTYLAPYGNVWVPNGVDEDWRPYYNGRWTWLPISGWTWWPYEPWGWSTFHYGRWHWGLDLGWYWIPMSMWGPGWVDWWWDDFYFGWAPLSYWGYPGVLMGGMYYGHYYGGYYPYQSRALTVVRREHLKDPHLAANALRGDSLKGLNRISLTNRTLSLRPVGTKISVQPLNGNRVMLRNDGSTGLERDARTGRQAIGGANNSGGPRAIRKPDAPSTSKGTTRGTAAKPQSVKSPSRGAKSPPGRPGPRARAGASPKRKTAVRRRPRAPPEATRAIRPSPGRARARERRGRPTAIPPRPPSRGRRIMVTAAAAGHGRSRDLIPGRPREARSPGLRQGAQADLPALRAGRGSDRHREDRAAARRAAVRRGEVPREARDPRPGARPRARAAPAVALTESSNPFPSGASLSSWPVWEGRPLFFYQCSSVALSFP